MISAIYLGIVVSISWLLFHQRLRWIPSLNEIIESTADRDDANDRSIFSRLMETHYEDVISEASLNFTKFREDVLFPQKEKYLIYFPYEGLGNQRLCLLRALYAARHLNRTLLIPPLMASLHNKMNHLRIDWRYLYDFSQFETNEAIKAPFKFISFRMIQNVRKLLESKGAECFTHDRCVGFKDLSFNSRQFLYQFGLSWRGRYDWHNITGLATEKATYMMDYFKKKSNVPLLCATNFQYVSFGTSMSEYWDKLLPSRNIILAAWNFMSIHGITKERYAAIHWRRGDFQWYCRKKDRPSCWPSLEDLKARILKIHEEHGIDLFLVGTNERSFRLDLSENGIDVVHITLPQTGQDEPSQWRELAPVALDEFLFEHSDCFVGNKFSSLSFSVMKRRCKAGLQHLTETF